MWNILELSELFVCLGKLVTFFSAWGTEKNVGFRSARGDQYGS